MYYDAGFGYTNFVSELCRVPFRYMTKSIVFPELYTAPLLKYVVTGYIGIPRIGSVVLIYTFLISKIVLRINSLINGHSWNNLGNKLN